MTSFGFRQRLLAAVFLLAMLVQASVASPVSVDSGEIRSACWATASLTEDIATVVQTGERWSCKDRHLSIDAERVLLRFEVAADGMLPRYFLSRRSALEAIHLLAVDKNGAVREKTVAAADLRSSMTGGYFSAALPEVTRDTQSIVAVIDQPTHRMTLERAYIAPIDAIGNMGDIPFLIILAALTGMLVMPLIFNAAFYRALREPFVLWHSALTFSLLMTILVSSGLSVILFDPPAMTLSWMTTLIFGLTVASGAMFTYSFIEPGLMNPILRRALPYCAVWAVMLSVFHAAFPFVARPIQSSIYTAAFAPVLTIFVLSMIDALRRGSRAARFQAIGYTPIILVGLTRLVTGIVPGLHNIDATLLFYFGCVFEVIFTTLGVADRFVHMKHDRDRARNDAELLERLSETDSLTGLFNRRAIERQFEQLQNNGFTALAVIDIDHFKSINDLYGHGIGDEVLKAVACALAAGSTVRAYRLGGEEFLLLLKGPDAQFQAELRRQAISTIVAQKVEGLLMPVTASMGFTYHTCNESFATIYERADKLLYEAKSFGRNRTRTALGEPLLLSSDQNAEEMIA